MSIGFLRGGIIWGLINCQTASPTMMVRSIEKRILLLVPKATRDRLSGFGLRSVLLCDFSLSYIRISRKVGRGTDWWLWVGCWG